MNFMGGKKEGPEKIGDMWGRREERGRGDESGKRGRKQERR